MGESQKSTTRLRNAPLLRSRSSGRELRQFASQTSAVCAAEDWRDAVGGSLFSAVYMEQYNAYVQACKQAGYDVSKTARGATLSSEQTHASLQSHMPAVLAAAKACAADGCCRVAASSCLAGSGARPTRAAAV